MRMLQIQFPHHQSLGVLLDRGEHLPQAIASLGLNDSQPVIVLLGGFIHDQHAGVTQKAMEVIAALAEEMCALIICGGSEVGIMGSIGRTRAAHRYQFPLIGITLEKLVTWPNGPRSKRFLWWGEKRWPLSTGYSHFILTPGDHFGEDSPWIAQAAACLSKGNRSVTILANGGLISRQDIALSLEQSRPVIVLAGTGRLADELANQPDKPSLISSVRAEDGNAIRQAIQLTLFTNKENLK